MPRFARCTLIACLAFPGLLFAADQVETEVEATLMHLAERGALGSFDKPISIARPAQVRYELGAVVDVRAPDRKGLEVLAITPGGAAARMGLETGDRLLAINGRRLDGDSPPADALTGAMRDSAGKLELLAARGGKPVELAGSVAPAAVPAYRLTIGETGGASPAGCGYVSYAMLPPRSQGLFEVVITTIDGRSTPLGQVNRLRVPAGRHVLTIAERTPAHRFSRSQNIQRSLALRQLMQRAYKPLVVDVEPGTEYRIGARLFTDRLGNDDIRANRYWEPVAWEQRPASCP